MVFIELLWVLATQNLCSSLSVIHYKTCSSSLTFLVQRDIRDIVLFIVVVHLFFTTFVLQDFTSCWYVICMPYVSIVAAVLI
jgi:hypothetical protein